MALVSTYTFFRASGSVITHYKKSEKGKKIPFSGATIFIMEYVQDLPSSEKTAYFAEIEKSTYQECFDKLLLLATVVEVQANHKSGHSLMGENYIYIQFVNEDRNKCNVLLRVNDATNTFVNMGQSSDDRLSDDMHIALSSSLNPAIVSWYENLLQSGAEKGLKTHKSIMLAHLSYLYKTPEFQIADIATISNDPTVPNFAYFNLDEIKNLPITPTPVWDQFCSMFDSEEKVDLFRAWVFSIFDAQNMGRQMLWIQGNGQEGKSTMYNVILRYMDMKFGRSRSYFAVTNVSHDNNRFFFSQAEGKRLCVFGDTRERGVLRNEHFLKLSGYDATVVEAKNKQAYSARIYAKIMLLSNWFPEVNFASRAEVSRIIVLRLQPDIARKLIKNRTGEAEAGNRLFDEFESFLRKCYDSYMRCLKPGSHDFYLPEIVVDGMLSHCMTHQYQIEQYFVKHGLEFGPSFQTPIAVLQNHLKRFGAEDLGSRTLKFNLENIRMILEDKYNCKYIYLRTTTGLDIPYVVGCRIQERFTKTFIELFREDTAKSVDITEL